MQQNNKSNASTTTGQALATIPKPESLTGLKRGETGLLHLTTAKETEVTALVGSSEACLTSSTKQWIYSIAAAIRSEKETGMANFTSIPKITEIPENEVEGVLNHFELLSAVVEPTLCDKLSSEAYVKRSAIIAADVTMLFASYKWTYRPDDNLMTAKTAAWVEVLGKYPLWAIKKGIKTHMHLGDPEPDNPAAFAHKRIWPLVSDYHNHIEAIRPLTNPIAESGDCAIVGSEKIKQLSEQLSVGM